MEKYNILYIEDNPTDFEMVKAILEEEGILSELKNARNRDEFIDAIENWPFDLILTDYSLPVFHGIEAISIAREMCPEKPVIMITGTLPDEIAVDVIKKGAWDYVLKENVYRLIPSIRAVMEKLQIQNDRKQALEALKESEENYRVLASSSPYGIIVHSEGKILYHNKEAVRIFSGNERKSYLGINVLDYVPPGQKDLINKLHEDVYKGKGTGSITELKYLNLKGEEIIIEIAASHIKFKGKPAAQVIFRDIAERKKMEQDLIDAKERAEESDKLKTAFLENLSHEIRTPLNGILGFATLLKANDVNNEDKLAYVNIIEESGKHLLSIINDLIEVSRIETGQINLKQETFNLNQLLDETFIFFNDGARYKEKPVILGITKSLPDKDAFVEADKARLTQIIYNLIANAYKFTMEGRIDFGYIVQENNNLMFFVKDTGIGIPEKAQAVVFERFRQADDSTTRLYGGTGLGLTISRGLVEAMGGKIWLKSEPEKGTEFHFEIPLKTFRINQPDVEEEVLNDKYNWKDKSLLIAEDEQSNFILLKHILGKTGIKITHVTTGLDVIRRINSGESYDLMLLDIKMPGMSGMETLRILREKNLDIPVIAQTAYAMSDDREKCLSEGFNEYVTKPIKANELLSKMQRLFLHGILKEEY